MATRKLLLDTNLLVLLIVGLASIEMIDRHRRTRTGYSRQDFRLLKALVDRHEVLLTTPNIISEASNLLIESDGCYSQRCAQILRAVLQSGHERYVASKEAAARSCMPRLGITDCAILELLDGSTLLITSDLGLYLEALEIDPSVKNFNHLREELM
jgi:hypothetical protein